MGVARDLHRRCIYFYVSEFVQKHLKLIVLILVVLIMLVTLISAALFAMRNFFLLCVDVILTAFSAGSFF